MHHTQLYWGLHIQPYYKEMGFKEGDFPEAEHYYQGAISLPLFYELSEKDQDYVVRTLQKVLS